MNRDSAAAELAARATADRVRHLMAGAVTPADISAEGLRRLADEVARLHATHAAFREGLAAAPVRPPSTRKHSRGFIVAAAKAGITLP